MRKTFCDYCGILLEERDVNVVNVEKLLSPAELAGKYSVTVTIVRKLTQHTAETSVSDVCTDCRRALAVGAISAVPPEDKHGREANRQARTDLEQLLNGHPPTVGEADAPMVYIAGPITKGDQAKNVRQAIDAFIQLADAGLVPVLPHTHWFVHLVHHRDWSYWMRIDREAIKRCDALLRLPGESKGASEEVEQARRAKKPVFATTYECIRHYTKEGVIR